jgi:hypothetical protein
MITQPNVVNSRVLYDSGEKTVIQIIGYYTAACTTATTVIADPKSLRYANTQQYCSVSVDSIQYHSSMTGFVSLEWEGTTSNSSFFVLGVGAGTMPLGAVNEAVGPTGNIRAVVTNASGNDNFSATLTLLKSTGFANASAWFGDGRP